MAATRPETVPETASSARMPDAAPESAAARRRRMGLFAGIALGVVVADQLVKTWIDASFALTVPGAAAGEPGAPTPVIGDLVRIAKTYNDGGIFGLFGAAGPVLGLLSIAIIAGIAWYEWRHGAVGGPVVTVGLGLLLGGALGNLVDRARFGHVVDYVDAGIGTSRFYAFNVADAAISIGILLLVVAALLGDRLPGRPSAGSSPATGASR
jgi:signal peptidase II